MSFSETCDEECRVFVVSDLNGSYGSTTYSREVKRAVQYIISQKPNLVISTGDHVAGQKKGLNYQAMWNSFHKEVTQPLAESSIPFLPSPGNHDASRGQAYQKERKVYQKNFKLPPNEVKFLDVKHFPFKYAFQLGSTLFIALDATSLTIDAEQLTWLDKTLKNNAHFNTKIIFGHVPLFPIAKGREREYLRNPHLFKLIKSHNVTLWLSGHHHAYYPGVKDGVKFYGINCLGGGPRKLLSPTGGYSPKGIVEIIIKNNQISEIQSLDVKNEFSIIDKTLLPSEVGNDGKKLKLDI